MIKKLDGLIETVDFESSLLFVLYYNTQEEDYPRHWHSAVEIIMPTKGPYNVMVNDMLYNLNEFDIFIVPSGDLHELTTSTNNGERIILQFDLSIFKTIENFINSSYIFLKPNLITPENNVDLHSSLKKILLEIFDENQLKNNYYEASIIAKIITLAVTIAKKQNFEVNQGADYFVKKKEHITTFNKCIDYISQHYKDNLTLDYISNIAGFSKFHFLRWFKQYSKMTFNDYLLQIRIKAAENLLTDFNIPITDVALESGFQSITTFNRVFKNLKKCTPTEYRNYLKNSAIPEDREQDDVRNEVSYHESANFIATINPPSIRFPDIKNNFEILSDIPEPDIIRVSETFYMVSSSAHFMPGCPIMKSYDLINWEVVNYTYDVIADDDAFALKNEKNAYGESIRTPCLKYQDGIFYIAFVSYKTRKTYIYQSNDIENGSWEKFVLDEIFHDLSLIFDDNNIFIVHGGNSLNITELNRQGNGIKENGLNKSIIKNINSVDGIKVYKKNGFFYIFLLGRVLGGAKTNLCLRSAKVDGRYEIFSSGSNENSPISIIETINNDWYAVKCLDRGGTGRTPVFGSVEWEDNWPILHFDRPPVLEMSDKKIGGFIAADEFYQGKKRIYSKNKLLLGNVFSLASYKNDIKNTNFEILDNINFDNGLSSWISHRSANLSIKNSEFETGRYMLYVSGRKYTSSGPLQIITGRVEKGERFLFSAVLKYISGPKWHTFNVAIANGKDMRDVQIMGSTRVKRGEWCTIEGVYTLPMNVDASATAVFVETLWNDQPSKEDDLMSFYVSKVSMIKKHSLNLNGILEGEYDYNGSNLLLQWQWNHNPNNNFWSLTDRIGYLRLTAGSICNNLSDARNTLTQRTFYPECSGSIALEVGGMKNGDVAGLAAFHKNYIYIGIRMMGDKKYIVIADYRTDSRHQTSGIPLEKERVYLKTDFDFHNPSGKVYFYYSLDGIEWFPIKNEFPLPHNSPNPIGYRFGLFYFAGESIGGFVDFDYFRLNNKLIKNSELSTVLNAGIVLPKTADGVPGTEVDLIIQADSLKEKIVKSIHVSLYIPNCFDIIRVVFNEDNLSGQTSYFIENGRLELSVIGEIAYVSKLSDVFATVKLKVNSYTPDNETINIKPDYFRVDGENIVYNFNKEGATIIMTQNTLKTAAKIPGTSNPLIDHKYGADPYALVFDGRVYIYLTSDAYEYRDGVLIDNTYGKIASITVISSADLVNWTDHGEIPVAGKDGVAKWANHSWAPAIAHKKINGQDKFFLYFANDASNIGVLCADSPIGPWSDPLGTSIINRSIPGVESVTWCFDPAVLVDDDGIGYLYFGGGLPSDNQEDVLHPKTARVIKLGDDMISVVGEAILIDAPALFEDSGIHKLNGKYYYSYCSNFAGTHPEDYPPKGEISYMVSDNPMGPFKYIGPILKNPQHFFGVGGNNHHAIFEFNGKWYITYHAQTLGKALEQVKGYRSPHINEVSFYSNGNIKEITADMKGVSAIKTFNPFNQTNAATFAWMSGVETAAFDNYNHLMLTKIKNNNWTVISNADFGSKGATSFSAFVKSLKSGSIEIRTGSHDGEIIGVLKINTEDKDWILKSCDIKKTTGIHDIFFIYKGDDGDSLFEINYWNFFE